MILNQRQALDVAVEMEKRAIRIYERALLLTADEQVLSGIRNILAEEQEHLRRFIQMRGERALSSAEERVLTEAMAAEALFPGGVMAMTRLDALTTLPGLYRFAARSEQEAIDRYVAFASQCEDEAVCEAFRAIAREEVTHLAALNQSLADLEAKA